MEQRWGPSRRDLRKRPRLLGKYGGGEGAAKREQFYHFYYFTVRKNKTVLSSRSTHQGRTFAIRQRALLPYIGEP